MQEVNGAIFFFSVYYGMGSSSGSSGSSNSNFSGESSSAPIIEVVILEDDNPLIFVHCGSFEYYKPPGSSVIAAAVEGIEQTFFALDINKQKVGQKIVFIKLDRAYFTLPSWRRYGEAANLTAEAVTKAKRLVEAWHLLNFSASKETLRDKWLSSLKIAMSSIGRQFSSFEPFLMNNAGNYQESLLTNGDSG